MRQEIERLQDEAGRAATEFGDERVELERLLAVAREETEQISCVYEQENRMRQELEVQVDLVRSVEA